MRVLMSPYIRDSWGNFDFFKKLFPISLPKNKEEIIATIYQIF